MRTGSFTVRAVVNSATVALSLMGAPAGAQVILSIPTGLTAHPGETVTIPVNLTVGDNRLDSAHGSGIATVGFVINYDPGLGTVPGSAIALGSLLDPDGTNPFGFPPYGGNAFDTAGQVVGVVTGKVDALRIAVATGNIPENINFAIKTGVLRDFLDNSVVPYQNAEPKGELKTTDIAGNARPYTMLISCNATEQAEAKR